MTILRLAIPSPLRREFDYLPPQDLSEARAAALQPGIRVLAPFGHRQLTGYLVAVLADSAIDSGKLKEAIAILDTQPLISTALIKLCQWAANYYQHPLGEVIPAAFSQGFGRSNGDRPRFYHCR
jgi:primosomal protein N' (replication factor Y)